MNMDVSIDELRSALGPDFDVMLAEVVGAVNRAGPGRIIADSEEPVRDSLALFRQHAFQKALELRQLKGESAFSPSADGDGRSLEE